MKYFKFKALLQESDWMSPAYVGVSDQGIIRYLSHLAPTEAVSVEFISGFALPGFQNAHSHAFQYAMAGKAEKHLPGLSDDFWSWREVMYRYALIMSPDHVEAVAAMLYAEMLRKGYTHVAEFHYLHHDVNGKQYTNRAEIGECLISAAKNVGINITLVPVFYQNSNFGKEATAQQRRFISKNTEDYFRLLDDSARAVQNQSHALLGFGVHSLRAVGHQEIIQTFIQGPADIPFHLHVAEQKKEVEDCLQYLKMRPVTWLLDSLPVNDRFHLLHCTHMDDHEVSALAKSSANVILCPGTEGNLGDGIFRLSDYAQHNGRWCIGTDSHINLNLMEDLRWLDYAQRITTHKRNTFDDARMLFKNPIKSGRRAMGVSATDFFELGRPFDAVIFDAESPLLNQAELSQLLSTIVYTTDASEIYGTIVNGEWIVRGKHRDHEQIVSRFLKTMRSLRRMG